MGSGASSQKRPPASTSSSRHDCPAQQPEEEERDAMSEQEVEGLLSSVLQSLQEEDEDDLQSFESLLEGEGGLRSLMRRHFCGSVEEDGAYTPALIRRSTVLRLQAFTMNVYLQDKLGISTPLHRELICKYIMEHNTSDRGEQEGSANDDKIIGKRKTQRFITGIDLTEKCITCVRRSVLPSDFAISHRWHARPTDSQWHVVEHTHTDDCWDDGGCMYINYDPCALWGNDLYCNYIKKDWYVKCTGEESLGGRVLAYPDRSYRCSLTQTEIENLHTLLKTKKSLWCDYICINQADPIDKAEQIPLMGNLYFTACTLVLGTDFAFCMPPDDYVFRAWCIQERDYGCIECNWDFESPTFDKFSLRQFVFELLKRIPIVTQNQPTIEVDLLRHASQGINLCAVYEFVRWYNFDNEPINEMTPEKISSLGNIINQLLGEYLCKIYPQYKTEILEVRDGVLAAIQNVGYDDDDVKISKNFLKLREIIPCSGDADPLLCQYQIFDSQASFTEDKIYAIWGVPMWMRHQQQLPYPNHSESLNLIFKTYPTAEFAFYKRPQRFVSFSYFTHVQDIMINFLTGGEFVAKQYPYSLHEYHLSTSTTPTKEYDNSIGSVVVAMDDKCMGVGLRKMSETSDEIVEMWVVFNKRMLHMLFDADVDLFSRLCFVYVLYEVGLFNKENQEERLKLFKFCLQLANMKS